MAYFDQFTLPVKGLHLGIHEYKFVVDDVFFQGKESTLIESGRFEIEITLDKHIDMMVVGIGFEGYWNTTCDRCTADIALPVTGSSEYLIKYAAAESDEGDIIYVMKETSELNIANLILDSITVGLPISKTFDCDAMDVRPCDAGVLASLERWSNNDLPEVNDIWAGLQGLQIDSEE